ncbi:MAG: hypothetical protein Q4B69_00115 [Slackia sp.]|nr:hypothetical protein [Slackia sp.]
MAADKRTGIRRFLLAAACLLALCAGAAAWAVEGDGSSREGAVVETEQTALEEAPPAEDAPDASSSEGAPAPLDAAGNEIVDGQVSDTSFLYDAAIADLAGADSYYDGQTVQVRGEAVGEAIRMTEGQGDCVWVTLVDPESGSSVSVVMKRADAERIDTFGAYGKTGSRLSVQGVYNLACSEHEGESDIHASVVTVEAKGYEHPDSFDVQMFFPGLAAVILGAFFMVIFWYVRERSR